LDETVSLKLASDDKKMYNNLVKLTNKNKKKEQQMKNLFTYEGVVTNIVDGDTIDIEFDLGFSIKFTERVRLYGIDAYEPTLRKGTTEEKKKLGIEAKAYLIEKLQGQIVFVETIKDEKGKFGRYLANVSYKGTLINEDMVNKGYAVEYAYS